MDEEIYEGAIVEVKRNIPVVYCGPDKPKLGLRRNAVFYGELPAPYVDAIMTVPEVEKLIVPYTQIGAMRKKISQSGTPEHEYYVRIASV